MRRIAILGAIFLGLSGAAQAHTFSAGHALLRASAQIAKTADVAQPRCPAEVPVQMITVINQAHASQFALAKVERAVVDQSMQLRAAWGTPCVQFGPGGWRLYLKGCSGPDLGLHAYDGEPYALVWTYGLSYLAWSTPFSHEVVEMLVDPTTVRTYYAGTKAIETVSSLGDGPATEVELNPVEIADPVEQRAYRLADVWVSDFVLPSWFAGAPSVPCTGNSGDVPFCYCDPSQGFACGTLIAPADAAGPYDEMDLLSGPWDTQWGTQGD